MNNNFRATAFIYFFLKIHPPLTGNEWHNMPVLASGVMSSKLLHDPETFPGRGLFSGIHLDEFRDRFNPGIYMQLFVETGPWSGFDRFSYNNSDS